MVTALLAFLIFSAVVTLWMLFDLYLGMRRMPKLEKVETDRPVEFWQSVSVIVAARDEAHTIETALQSLLHLDYPKLQIIVVNDRSKDGTGEILDRMASEDSRLTVVHLTELPPGWLGKNHACWQGSKAAAGAWLFFTDADVVFNPKALKQAIALAIGRNWDHLVALPRAINETFIERAYVAYFSLMLMLRGRSYLPSKDTNSPEFGVGAFNLVKRSIYDRFGGHSAIPLSVDDDMKLGYQIIKAGGKRGVAYGIRTMELVWQVGIGGLIRGLEKNSFAVLNFNWLTLIGVSLMLGSWAILPYLSLLVDDLNVRVWAVINILIQWAMYPALGDYEEYDPKVCVFHPISNLLFIYTMWRSAFITTRQGGIRWRDTFYPLALLKNRQKGSIPRIEDGE